MAFAPALPYSQTYMTAVATRELPLDSLEPNPYQPRRAFDPDELRDLAQSIREVGVLQDVIVRPLKTKGKAKVQAPRYQLVSGERRVRASRLAGLTTIPAKVRELSDLEVSRLALVENVQRADLNPLDEARGIQNHIRLAASHGQELSFDDVRRMLGKSPGWLEKKRALLKLPDYMQEAVTRNGAVQSSVLEINRLPETLVDERHTLVDEVDNGATYSQVKGRVEQLLEAHADREAWRKESQEAPDKVTRDAQTHEARRSQEARRELETQLGNAEGALLNALAWLRRLTPEDYQVSVPPRLKRLRARLDELQSEGERKR